MSAILSILALILATLNPIDAPIRGGSVEDGPDPIIVVNPNPDPDPDPNDDEQGGG